MLEDVKACFAEHFNSKSLSFFNKRPFILPHKNNLRPLLIRLAVYNNWQLTAILGDAQNTLLRDIFCYVTSLTFEGALA